MPIKDKTKPGRPSLIIYLIIMLGAVLVSKIDKDYYNLFIFSMFGIAFIISTIFWILSTRDTRSCTRRSKAIVGSIERNEKYTRLKLYYLVNNVKFSSVVSYHEEQVPNNRQVVGIYYNPNNPEICMLSIYKKHKPGWSHVNSSEMDKNTIGMYIMGALLIMCSFMFTSIAGDRYETYTEQTQGIVIDYESEFKHHSARTPGTYSYTPIIEYEVNRKKQTARSAESWFTHPFDIGETVDIKYDPNRLDNVLIEGIRPTQVSVYILIGFGILFIALGASKQIRNKKSQNNVFGEYQRIDFNEGDDQR